MSTSLARASSTLRWSCMQCTFNNATTDAQCTICDAAKPTNFTLRFRTPSELFNLDLQSHTTVDVLRILLESRSGIPVACQKLFYGTPRRELFGRDAEHVARVLDLKPGTDDVTITVEIKETPSPTKRSGGAFGAQADGDTVMDEGEGDDAEDLTLPYLELFSGGDLSAPSPSPMSTTECCSADEDDPFADAGDADDADGWGADDGGDFGDDFVDDGEADESALKKQQASETKSEARNTVLQSSSKNKKLGVYDILNVRTLLSMMKRALAELDETIGCSNSEAAILLRHYRWNKDRLFQDYLENPAKVQEKCGLLRMKHRFAAADSNQAANSSVATAASAAAPGAAAVSYGDCTLCGDEMTPTTSFDLGCTLDGSHRFCNECWKNWLTAEMDKGPQAVFTTCCGFKCKELVPDDVFLNFLTGRKRRLLSKWLIRNFVDSKPDLKWCTNSRCTMVVRFDGGARDIECACGERFCFACGINESHSPCQCEIVAQWNKKNSSDRENSDWITANTKPCPGCKTNTEKNSGCNHMTCKHCKFEYCWLCLGSWAKHNSASGGYYACNVYQKEHASGPSKQEKSMEEAQARIKRYQFYFERTLEYERSIQSAVRQVGVTESRMVELQALTGGDLASVEFLLDANKTVIECRRALKWSYVIAFYLQPDSRQLHMFQLDQGQLEKFSDELHGLIELPVDQLLPVLQASKPTAAAAASPAAASSVSSPTAAVASASTSAVHLQGDELKRVIISRTNVANKYLVNLVDAVAAGQYIDLTLQRLPSA